MGNSSSSGRGHHEETVDFGHLVPQGIYTGPRDWNQAIVAQLIGERKLAPFYRPLEDYEESWDDDQIIAARKEPPDADGAASGESSSLRAESVNSSNSKTHHKRTSNAKEPMRHPEAGAYRGAAECPICFLYYPPNINRSRCCDQAICTECFVQIKRSEPTATHLVSEPAACPYCVQENFGVVYTPPSWRAGLGSDGAPTPPWLDPLRGNSHQDTSPANTSMKRRRKSFGATDPEVVTIDMIRPDWEAKLAAVRATVARRANRRIIMRQVGDRLIPVGITSGRVHALPAEDGQADGEPSGERGSRRSRRRGQQNQDINQLLGSMGLGGQDLEELMLMEAMRLSLLEHEEQQKREREEAAKKAKEQGEGAPQEGESASSSQAPVPANSTLDGSDGGAPASPASGSDVASANDGSSTEGASEARLSPTESDAPSGGPPSQVDLSTGEPSTLATALHSAVSLASAIGSPSPGDGADAESGSRPRTPALSPDSIAVSSNANSLSEPSSGARRIPLQHANSIASSVEPSDSPAYDLLSSSPDSTVSHKPLLQHADSVSAPVTFSPEHAHD